LAERLVVLRAGETRQVHGRTAPVA
jgi:hypothetical protein